VKTAHHDVQLVETALTYPEHKLYGGAAIANGFDLLEDGFAINNKGLRLTPPGGLVTGDELNRLIKRQKVHLSGVSNDPVPAIILGSVKRLIGPFQEIFRGITRTPQSGYPDRCGDILGQAAPFQ